MEKTNDERLQTHLLHAGIAVPISVIEAWEDNDKAWAEIYADNMLVQRSFGFSASPSLPECLRPYIERKDKPYDGHGLA